MSNTINELWNDYADNFNLLSEIIQNAGMDVILLQDLLNAYEKVLRQNIRDGN